MTVVLLALVALLPAKKFYTSETFYPGDQIQAAQDESDSVALVIRVAGPQFSREAIRFVPEAGFFSGESAVVLSHCYRGPPALS